MSRGFRGGGESCQSWQFHVRAGARARGLVSGNEGEVRRLHRAG